MKKGQAVRRAAALLATCAIGTFSIAHARELHVAPTDDAALSVLLLSTKGNMAPVLLFDPWDPESVTRFNGRFNENVHCWYRQVTHGSIVEHMQRAIGKPCTRVDSVIDLAHSLRPEASEAIVVDERQYVPLLRAAALASARKAVLLPLAPQPPEGATLRDWRPETVYLPRDMKAWRLFFEPVAKRIEELPLTEELRPQMFRPADEDSAMTVVVANPKDRTAMFSPSSLSLLAPLVSGSHRAPLILVDSAEPQEIERQVLAYLDSHGLGPTHMILVGDELALRSHVVPDPVLAAGGPEARGGGIEIRVELFSEIQHERPQDFAVGRIVAEDAAQGSALLARQLHSSSVSKKPVIFLTNADEIFALGETISRTTIAELRNLAVPVRAYYRDQITPDVIHRALAQTDLLVWEGHPRDLTLEERGGIGAETAPDLVVLQGCYTLDRSDPFILLQKGAKAIVATSAAIYSSSGSAFARALFDRLLYEGADLGSAVRDARNYLLALANLKRARKQKDWTKTYRAALSFALWGDPTLKAPIRPKAAQLKPVKWDLHEEKLSLEIPRASLPAVHVGRYRASPRPRAMLAGLLIPGSEDGTRQLKELYFTVRSVPPSRAWVCPPGNGWRVASLYAPRTRTLTVVARPDWKMLGHAARRQPFTFPLVDDPSTCASPSTPAE
jgi:hypothetical protein